MELQDDAAQHPEVHKLRTYLKNLFAGETLMYVPILHAKLFSTYLVDFSNVKIFLTAIAKTKVRSKLPELQWIPVLMQGQYSLELGRGTHFTGL